MKNLKIIVIFSTLLVFAGLSSCGGSKQNESAPTFKKNPPFTLKSSYYQDWVAGIEEGGSGTRVFFTFDRLRENVVLKEIFYKNMKTEAKTSSNMRMQYKGEFKEVPRDFIMDSDPMKEAENKFVSAFPFNLAPNECVFSYTFKNELYYYKIENMERKESLAYPQGNPNRDN